MSQESDPQDPQTIRLRTLVIEDYEAVVGLQLECFPGMIPWQRSQFESQLKQFPEGQFGIEIDGRLVATASSLIVDHDEYTDWQNWQEMSDGGNIRNHDVDGDTLYGIEMQVSPEFRGMKLSRRLYDARKSLCREHNLERMVVGGRIPGYESHSEAMSAEEYVAAVTAKQLFDPVLTSQISNGFQLRRVVAGYLPSDGASAGHATELEWTNIDYISARRRRHRRAVFPVRTAVIQYPMRRIASFEEFAQQIEYYVDTVSDYRSDFVLFPELISTQLLCLTSARSPSAQVRELAGYGEQYVNMFRQLALSYNVNIIGGSTFILEADRLFNIAFLFRRDGTIEQQKKLHIPPAEARWWGVQGGDKLETFETDRGRVGILVCYDVEFPEPCRILAEQGARILFVPFNTNDRPGYQRVRNCAAARAVENHQYVVMAGCVGHLPGVDNADLHFAQSAVLSPCDISFPADGVVGEASPAIEQILVQDLDLEQLRRHRAMGTVRNWDDRRLDLYSVDWKGNSA